VTFKLRQPALHIRATTTPLTLVITNRLLRIGSLLHNSLRVALAMVVALASVGCEVTVTHHSAATNTQSNGNGQGSDLRLSVAPGSINLTAGGDAQTIQVSVSPASNATDPVTVALSGLPSGVTASPSSLTLHAGVKQPITFSAAQNTGAGTTEATLLGTSGYQSLSAAVTLTIAAQPSGGRSSPPSLPSGYNVLYTFVANGDQTGTVLHDISGNGNDGTFAAVGPSWTGTGLYFGASPDAAGVNLPASLNSDTTFCVVANLPVDPGLFTHFKGFASFLVGTTFNGGGGVAWTLNDEAIDASSVQTFQQNGTGEMNGVEGELGTHSWCLIQGLTSNGTQDRAFLDGVENTYRNWGVTGGLQTTGNYTLGAANISPGFFGFPGTMYALVGYPAQLDATQIQQISSSLLQSVGERGVQIAPVTAKDGGPYLTALGDSITGGYGAAAGWPAYLSLTPSLTIINNGVFNLESPGALANVLWRDAPNCYSYNGRSIATIAIGINDPQIGYSPQQTMNSILDLAAIDSQAGCRVLVATLTSSASNNTFKNVLNPLIRANAAQGGYTVVDFGEDTFMGCDSCYTNPTYFNSDRIHPNTTGQQELGAVASNAINSALGNTAANPTVVSANTYSMVSGDNFLTMIPTAEATVTLPSCTAATGLVYTVTNASAGAFPIVMSGQPSEAITGDGTIAQNVTGKFQAELISQTTGGCGWLRIQ
jgi:lysophospholipase L1-like esterase